MIYVQGFFSAQTSTSTSSGNPSTTQFQVPVFNDYFLFKYFFLNMSTLIIYHELFNWHGGGGHYDISMFMKLHLLQNTTLSWYYILQIVQYLTMKLYFTKSYTMNNVKAPDGI